jgi:hypothetical protein
MNSYNDIPDAPWIRDAELNGYPENETIYCPVCGAEDPEEFIIIDGDVCGCENCTKRVDAYDWIIDRKRRGVA